MAKKEEAAKEKETRHTMHREKKKRVRTTRTVATKKALENLQGMGGVKRPVTGKVEHDMWIEDRKGERVSAQRYYDRWGDAAIGDRVDIRGEGKEEDEMCLQLIPRWLPCHAQR